MPANQTTIRCAQCGQPVPMPVYGLVDAKADPEAKRRLLNDQLNSTSCPHCGAVNKVMTPLLYHDPDKQLLIAYVPMEIGVQQGQDEERIVGDLMNQLTAQIDQKDFKAYMFSPKRALTLQGLIDQVLEADGVSAADRDAMKKRAELARQMLHAASPDALEALIKENDTTIDDDFIETLGVEAQRMAATGTPPDLSARMMRVQQALMQHSSVGKAAIQQQQVIREVAGALAALGETPQPDALAQLALSYAGEDEKLQAFVGLTQSELDDAVFSQMTVGISQAPAAERDGLEAARDRIRELKATIDAELQAAFAEINRRIDTLLASENLEADLRAQMDAMDRDFLSVLVERLRAAQSANDAQQLQKLEQLYVNVLPLVQVQVLQQMLNSSEPAAIAQANADLLDSNFMQLLQINMQQAQQQGNTAAIERFKAIQSIVAQVVQAQMPPEVQFINQLLSAPDDAQMRQMVQAQAAQFDGTLLQTIDQLDEILKQQGQTGLVQRLGTVREAVVAALS